MAIDFLKKKTNLHRWSVEKTCEMLVEVYSETEMYIHKTINAIQQTVGDSKKKLRKLEEAADDLKEDTISVQKLVENGRIPTSLPKEPVFPEFLPVAYVFNLPTVGKISNFNIYQ